MDEEWLRRFLSEPELHPNRTGQGTSSAGPPSFGGRCDCDEQSDIDTCNLGLGWLYYALARMYLVRNCVCIGSGRGFAPIILAKGIKDNGGGILHFVDPSLDDDFWKERERVVKWFSKFGVQEIITHHLATTEEFANTKVYKQLQDLDLVLIDACHFYESVAFDFETMLDKLSQKGIVALHDTISRSLNPRWHGPRRLVDRVLTTGQFQAFDFKLGAGMTLLQRITLEQTAAYPEWCAKQWDGRAPYDF